MPTHLLNELRPLPVQIAYADDESGLGYLLRWVHKNHLSWRWLRGQLRIRSKRQPDARDASVLSYLSGGDLSHLQHSLMRSFGSAKAGGLMVYGQQVLYKDLYRITHPQVCAACIHQQGYVSMHWEWGVLPVCPKHQTYLRDICKYCKKRLTWDRQPLIFARVDGPSQALQNQRKIPAHLK